jgi:hypothetical protein
MSADEPFVVVLPEPDVPEVLMLPEHDAYPEHNAYPDHDLPDAAPAPPSWSGQAGVPASRPEPGTLSLDELLVLHTRRPPATRNGSADDVLGPGTGG